MFSQIAEFEAVTAGEGDGGLAQLARARNADLIVPGSTHRGPVSRVVPGATVERLLHRSVTSRFMQEGACPVLIYPAGVRPPPSSEP